MAIGWKVLIPLSIVWILFIAVIRAWKLNFNSTAIYAVAGIVLVLLIIMVMAWDGAAQQRAIRNAPASAPDSAPPGEPDTLAGQPAAAAFPVPPLDLPHYHGTGLQAGPQTTATSTREVTGA
jgi:NADH-quinone oxidoreductase subunit H